MFEEKEKNSAKNKRNVIDTGRGLVVIIIFPIFSFATGAVFLVFFCFCSFLLLMVSLSREVFFALFLNQMKLFGRKKKQDDKTEYEQLRDDHGKNYEQNIKERSRGGEKGKKILFSFFF